MSLEVSGLCLSRGGSRVVHDVDLRVAAGELCVLVGPNAAGKSTLLQGLAGLLPPERGTVRLAGLSSRHAFARTHYMGQGARAGGTLRVDEVVLLARVQDLGWRVGSAQRRCVSRALARLGIAHLAERRITELSGGQQQLVFFAQALVREALCLLLDEPSSALDIRHQLLLAEQVHALTREDGVATIIAMHDLNLAARFADRIAILADGRIAATGTPAAVYRPALLAEVFGVEVAVHHCRVAGPRVELLRTRRDDATSARRVAGA